MKNVCPTCGGRPYFYQIYSHSKRKRVWKVRCVKDNGDINGCCNILNEFDTFEQTNAAWSTRLS